MKVKIINILSLILMLAAFNISLSAATLKVWKTTDANVKGSLRYAVENAKDGDTVKFLQKGKLKPIGENIYIGQKKLTIKGWNEVRQEMTKLPFYKFRFGEGHEITFKKVHFEFPKQISFTNGNFNFKSCVIDPYEQRYYEWINVSNGRTVNFEDCQFRGNGNTDITAAGAGSLVNISHCRIDGYISRQFSWSNAFRRSFEVCADNGGKVIITDNTYFSKEVMPEKINGVEPWIDTTYFTYNISSNGGTIEGSIRQGEKYENINLTSEILIRVY